MSANFSSFWTSFFGNKRYVLDCGDIDQIFSVIFHKYLPQRECICRETALRVAKGNGYISEKLCRTSCDPEEYQSMLTGFQQIVEAMVSLHHVRERCRRVCLWAQTQSDPILRELAFKIKCDQISRSEVAVYLTDTLQRILALHLDSKHRREPKRLRQHHPKE